jgi:hypothetical protein
MAAGRQDLARSYIPADKMFVPHRPDLFQDNHADKFQICVYKYSTMSL